MTTTITKFPKAVSSLSVPSLSAGLEAAISDTGNLNYTNDGYSWQPPAKATDSQRNEAQRIVAQLLHVLRPAPREVVMPWLIQFGTLVANNLSVADAKAKISAYALDLAYPLVCFTDESRRAAAVKFTWFPSFSELAQFLDSIAAPARIKLDRLRKIAGMTSQPEKRGKMWSELTPEEREAHEQMMAKLKASIANSDSPTHTAG